MFLSCNHLTGLEQNQMDLASKLLEMTFEMRNGNEIDGINLIWVLELGMLDMMEICA